MDSLVTTTIAGSATKLIGKLLGNTIKNTTLWGRHSTSQKQLGKIQEQKIRYGESIPNVYGYMKVAGNILWTSEISEYISTYKTYDKLQKEKHFDYNNCTISLIIGLCEGKISSVSNIWADDFLITDLSNIRIYLGDEEQEADPLIAGLYGEMAPSYKGLAYVMIQDFNISKFGNKLPNFTFEVFNNGIDKNSLESLVESLIIIPGCGEFVYDTKVQYKNDGEIIAINQHHTTGIANAVVALNQIKNVLPNVKWVSPVISWFGTSLNAGDCHIKPGIEYNNQHEPTWSVADFTRNNAYLISKNKNEQLNYGGTPSDESILRYLEYIKNEGYKVMFYPMMFLDIDGKPWRGNITGSSHDIQKFFNSENGYNKFIIHYAELVKDHVDAFLIGSEMQDMTKVQDESGNFPAVDELVKLADKVREIVGNNVKISYAANWCEYHSVNEIYHMDKLWASKNINFVGIDAYFPLTAVKKSEYNLDKIIEGWNSGVEYDFYYDGDKKIPLDEKYALKNIEFWWKNQLAD